jgi:hypothetical protein
MDAQKETAAAPVKEKEAAVAASPAQQLAESCDALLNLGGFDLLEASVEGVQNMNPERKARKKIFLTESTQKEEREKLKARLLKWHDLLKSADAVPDLVAKAQEKADTAGRLLKANLKGAVEASGQLEKSYRTVALFYKNTQSDKVDNISIVNASPEQLTDLDNPRTIDTIANELHHNFDRLDLRNNYSLLVLPGYLGSNKVVEKWAEIAHKNKAMLVTDFENLDRVDDVMEMFKAANLTGGDVYRSNVMMACNWLVGREKYEDLGEEEELFVPPSAALAGRIYSTIMSQPVAGKSFGGIKEVDGVRFPMLKEDISNMDKIGLVPMVNEYGKVMAFSAKTLFNGDNLGLQTYSVVRVFDYVAKVLIDFLNRRAFERWNTQTEADIRRQIIKFLDNIKGPSKLIEKFQIIRLERDPKQKDRIMLDIHMTPYFPAKTFLIKLDGTKGDDPDSAEWKAEYELSK